MASENHDPAKDLELRDRLLDGLAACGELSAGFHQPLERFLVGLCGRDDGRSRERAIEIAAKIIGECFRESPSLLEKWNGGGSLDAFLRTAGENRLKSWWRSAEKSRVSVNSDSTAMKIAARAEPADEVEASEAALATEALRRGVEAAMERAPEGLAFLRLKGLHGVDQRAIARCWELDESGISRRIATAMESIREVASGLLRGKLEASPYAALQQALQADPSILLGSKDGSGNAGHADGFLAGVASGRAGKQARFDAAKAMCRDCRDLALFASLLNRAAGAGPAVVTDPSLEGMQARLGECLRRTLELLRPAEVRALITPLVSSAFADALSLIRADGGTLWLLSPGDEMLEAVFNPLEPELAGLRQPLVSGIVSLVLATGETARVSNLSTHQRHSPAIDLALGKTTRAMIAVPFLFGGNLRGVITAVRLAGEDEFSEGQVDVLARHAEIIALLLTRGLEEKILR